MKQNKQKQYSQREEVKKQIIAVRDSGKMNMYDTTSVAYYAFNQGYFELFRFIVQEPRKYAKFILNGDDNLLPE